MNITKQIFHLNKYCLWFLCLFIVSGCVNLSKKDRIVGIQKNRIKKLEMQLAAKNKIIESNKVKKWVSAPAMIPERVALRPLKDEIKKRQWVKALKMSSSLKKKYPKSIQLIKYRVAIFKKMGLRKQAISEMNDYKKIVSSRKRKSRRQ